MRIKVLGFGEIQVPIYVIITIQPRMVETMDMIFLMDNYETQCLSGVMYEWYSDMDDIYEEAPAIIEKPLNFLKKAVLFVDQYIKELANLINNYAVDHELNAKIKFWEKAKKTMDPEFLKKKVRVQWCNAMVDNNDYFTQLLRNTDALLRAELTDPGAAALHEEYLKNIFSKCCGSDPQAYVTIDGLCNLCTRFVDDLQKERADLKYNLTHISKIIKNMSDDLSTTYISKLFTLISSKLKQKSICAMYNISSFWDCLKSIGSEYIDYQSGKLATLSGKDYKDEADFIQKVMKGANLVEEIDVMGRTFKIYATKYDGLAASIVDGVNIYVDKNFYKQPVSVQKGVIFHEIGHYVNGHFGPVKAVDYAKKLKQIRKDYDKFVRLATHSKFKDYFDDEEFIYLMCELEADRYANENIGGFTAKHALRKQSDQYFRTVIPKDPKNITDREQLLIDYNNERTKLRAKLS